MISWRVKHIFFLTQLRCNSKINTLKVLYGLLILTIPFIILISGVQSADDPLSLKERKWLNEHDGKIRINHESDWAPILFTDEDSNPSGIAFDYYSLIEKKLNFKFKVDSPHSWEGVYSRFKNDKLDVMCDIMENTERSKIALFTKPYIKMTSAIIVKNHRRGELSLAKMKGMKIAVVSRDITHEYLTKNYGYLTILPHKNTETCMLEVALGSVDAAIVNLASATYSINKAGISNLRIAGYSEQGYNLSFASTKNLPILNSILNKGLDLISPEEKKEIYQKWIVLNTGPFYKQRNFWIIIFGIASLAMGTITIISVWNWKLHREVDKRTARLAEQTLVLQKEVGSRKKTQKDLQERETHLRTLIETIPDLVWLKDPEGVYLSCNAKFEKYFGAREQDIRGKTDYDFVNKAQADAFGDHDKKVILSEMPLIIEEAINYADGGELAHLETIKTPMYDPGGKLVGVLGIGRDITTRKQTEQELDRYRNRLESILSNIQGLTYRRRMDPNFTMLFMSRHVKELSGYTHHDFTSNGIRTFESIIHKEDLKKVNDTIQRAIESSTPWELEYRIHHKDGSLFWVFEKGTVVHDIIGNAGYLDGFIINITKQKSMEEHLRQTLKIQAIGTLASGIAHDFNNILAGILGFSELLQEDIMRLKCSEKMHRRIDNILKGGLRAKELVAQILAFSRTEDEVVEPVSIALITRENLKAPACHPAQHH